MRLNHHLVPPLLLLAFATACSGNDSEQQQADVMRAAFPEQADQVLLGERKWLREADGYRVDASSSPWHPGQLDALVAYRAEDGIALNIAKDFQLRVHELGAHGRTSEIEGAVGYARTDGAAYWTGMAGGVEEWLLIEGDVRDPNVPVASWEVEGGWLSQHGEQILISPEQGAPARVAVSAPFAYGPDGRGLEIRLGLDGQRINVFVEASAGPLLVDPMWIDYAMMQDNQFFHAAGLLGNGRVIVTGGEDDQGVTGFSQVYNPATASWQAVGFSATRTLFTGTSISTGQVLFVGGYDGFGEIGDAITYDFMLGFQSRPGLFDARYNHTAVELDSGMVLVCGGQQNGGEVPAGTSGGFGTLDGCEMYNPLVPGWASSTPMNNPRQSHTVTKLLDGRVMQCAGCDDFGYLNNCELFNPQAPTNWVNTASFGPGRAGVTLTTLNDGRVLLVGGEQFGTSINAAALFNPATSTWAAAGSMLSGRQGHTASKLNDGRVLIVGGVDGNFAALDTAEIFDPLTNTFTPTVSITDARAMHSATVLANANVLVAGGADTNYVGVGSSMVFVNELPNGAPCTQATATNCLSNICEDNVCCDVTCAGTCMACSVAAKGGGAPGVCEPVLPFNDPDNECTDQGVASCGTNGYCDGAGSCAFYSTQDQCSGEGCMNDDIVIADMCSGSGTCIDNGVIDCGFYTCTTASETPECTTSCIDDMDCAVDGYCDFNGDCAGKKVLGAPAVNTNECGSGFVADGVCCDAACDLGECDACTAALGASADGVCTAVIGSCDDKNPCTIDSCLANGCGTESKLDGSPCPNGICIAGDCVLDASTSASSSATGTSSSSGGNVTVGGGGNGQGGGYDFDVGDASLEGSGICTSSGVGQRSNNGWMVTALGLALGLAGFRRRRVRADRLRQHEA